MSNNQSIEYISPDPNTRLVSKTDSVVDSVIDKFIQRSKVGKLKYNVDLDREDLSLQDWLTHLQEELQDAVLYIEKLKKVLPK